jgi:GTP cyclohydrolase II
MCTELSAPAEPVRLRLRQIHRAASDLRRGVPVVVDGPMPLLVLAAETAGVDGLAELEAIAGAELVLILAPARAAAALRKPMPSQAEAVAVLLPPFLRNLSTFQSLADPTTKQPVTRDAAEVSVET